jgi:hypothetical protein
MLNSVSSITPNEIRDAMRRNSVCLSGPVGDLLADWITAAVVVTVQTMMPGQSGTSGDEPTQKLRDLMISAAARDDEPPRMMTASVRVIHQDDADRVDGGMAAEAEPTSTPMREDLYDGVLDLSVPSDNIHSDIERILTEQSGINLRSGTMTPDNIMQSQDLPTVRNAESQLDDIPRLLSQLVAVGTAESSTVWSTEVVEQPPTVSKWFECDPSFHRDVMACCEVIKQPSALTPGCMKDMLTRALPQIRDTDADIVDRICCAAFVAAAWTMRHHDEGKEEASTNVPGNHSDDAACNLSAFVDRYLKAREATDRADQ